MNAKALQEAWDVSPTLPPIIFTDEEAATLTAALSPQALPAPGEVPEGMKPWAGSDAAPVDWDGGPVVLRNGSTMFPSNVSLAYHANGTNRWNHQRENRNPDWDIIAYSAALTPDATQTREAELVAAAQAVLDNADRPGSRMQFGNDGDVWIDHKEVDQTVLDRLSAALNGRGGA